jgi:hypothetical protein
MSQRRMSLGTIVDNSNEKYLRNTRIWQGKPIRLCPKNPKKPQKPMGSESTHKNKNKKVYWYAYKQLN